MRSDRLSPERGQLQFTQNLLRSVAYDTLTRREKRARHLAAAAQLRAEFPYDGAEVADVIAAHYQTVLDLDPDAPDAATVRSEAAAAYRQAGDRSADLGAPAAAFVAYRKAAQLLEGSGDDLDVIAAAGRMASRAARWAEAVDLLGKAVTRLEAEGRDDEARAVMAELANAHSSVGPSRRGHHVGTSGPGTHPSGCRRPRYRRSLAAAGKEPRFRGRNRRSGAPDRAGDRDRGIARRPKAPRRFARCRGGQVVVLRPYGHGAIGWRGGGRGGPGQRSARSAASELEQPG